MDVKILPRTLRGTVRAPASKSDCHRLLICAALSDGPTRVEIPDVSADIEATASCLKALGATLDYENGVYTVTPVREPASSPLLDCHESGSTLRFLLPVAAAVSKGARFTGSGRLPERPIGELREAMERNGVVFSAPALPLTLTGRLRSGVFELPGNVSSQYVTGLLLALPLVGGGEVRLTSPLESAGYVDMTVSTMEQFGISVRKTSDGFSVPEARYRSPGTVRAEGDYSSAAFFLCAGALTGEVTVTGLNPASVQGDKRILDLLREFGADVRTENGSVAVKRSDLRGITVSLTDVPDLLPVLAATAAFAEGETFFTDGARLRIKESDRLTAAARMLKALGGDVEERPDGLTVRGGSLRNGTVDGMNDHRIVMAAAVAGTAGDGAVITDAEAVRKSYPAFFDDFKALGGAADGVLLWK